MCIMEVRVGQRTSTIAQAMAHNVSTIERDLEMFEPLLRARGDRSALGLVGLARGHLQSATAYFLELFEAEVSAEVRSGLVKPGVDEPVGNERLSVSDRDIARQVETDIAAAEQYETRK